jgi:hypothetical protein
VRNHAWLVVLAVGTVEIMGCVATPPQSPPPPPQPRQVWDKEGATRDDFSKDRYECIQKTPLPNGPNTDYEMLTVLFTACMNAHGWYSVSEK